MSEEKAWQIIENWRSLGAEYDDLVDTIAKELRDNYDAGMKAAAEALRERDERIAALEAELKVKPMSEDKAAKTARELLPCNETRDCDLSWNGEEWITVHATSCPASRREAVAQALRERDERIAALEGLK